MSVEVTKIRTFFMRQFNRYNAEKKTVLKKSKWTNKRHHVRTIWHFIAIRNSCMKK
ncbi:unnamed protein product [Brugia timori]|uniref:Uncharacterized protein n=1 Tax=Brugia timori TaxID=42155 RepID=A0A0R3Q7R1_9BILA|nr:unnamed protein product [Brugia timori]